MQAIQIVGALFILLGYVMSQMGKWSAFSWAYLWVNLIGAVVLAFIAYFERQWGFLMLEVAWTTVTAATMFKQAKLATEE